MSDERREPVVPGDGEVAAMLGARASRVGASDAREVLAAARAEIAGHDSATGPVAGERGGRTFGVRPVRLEPRTTGRSPRMPWRLAVLGVAAVVAVAVLGSRLALGPTDVVPGASPDASGVASPDPLGSLPPISRLTADEMAAGIADGSLDGRTVLVDARLVHDPVPCPSATEDCFDLHIEGPVSAPVTRAAAVTLEAYTRNAGGGAPAAVSIAAGRVTLLGWVVAGVEAPLTVAELAGKDAPMPAGDLVEVGGWLLPDPPEPECIRLMLCDTWPRLTDAMPFVDGVPAYDTPGVNVGVDVALGLDDPLEFMVGRFLVESLGTPESRLPPYRVVATLDAAVQRVDQQVTRIDATPAPSPSVEPVGERMSAADFERAVRLGTLGERIVVVEGRMRLVIGRCLGTSEDCTWLQLEGLPNVWIDKGDLDVDEAGAAIRRHPNVAPIALRVSGYGVELIGWITAGASTPVEITALLAGDLPLDPGEVVAVAGWVVGAHPDPPCAATPETCAMWPVLQAQAPIPDAQIGYGVASMATMVDDSLGLGPAPAFRAGPFLVGARRAPAAFEPGIEVVAWFVDVVVVDPVPSESASPMPSPTSTPPHATPTDDSARLLTNDELMAALGNRSLDGRLLVIDTELRTVAWPCPADVPEPCTRFFVDGLPGIALTYDGMVSGSDGSDGGAGVSATTGRMIVVPRNGHLELLGRLDGDLGTPVSVGPGLALADPDPLGLRTVNGWLIHTPAPSGCPPDVPSADVSCTGDVNVLSPQPTEGRSLPAGAPRMGVVLRDERPGLEAFGTFAGGSFLVRPWYDVISCPAGTDCLLRASYQWEVVARYDPAGLVQVTLP